jgi:ketosteroid isomerase-like protein
VHSPVARIALILVACLVALVVLPGCGDDSQSAEEVAQEYVDARNDGDSAKVCELYTDKLRQRLGADKCAEFITEQTSGGTLKFELLDVEENGDTATATLQVSGNTQLPPERSQLNVSLAKQDGDWKVEGFGIGPAPGA